jgi:hypothetical protein
MGFNGLTGFAGWLASLIFADLLFQRRMFELGAQAA